MLPGSILIIFLKSEKNALKTLQPYYFGQEFPRQLPKLGKIRDEVKQLGELKCTRVGQAEMKEGKWEGRGWKSVMGIAREFKLFHARVPVNRHSLIDPRSWLTPGCVLTTSSGVVGRETTSAAVHVYLLSIKQCGRFSIFRRIDGLSSVSLSFNMGFVA